RFVACAILLMSCWLPLPASAIVITQIDTFEDGTTQNWTVGLGGHPFPPANVPTGGPAGIDDNYLRLTATGLNSPGGRLSAINFNSQWSGDYLAAGITDIWLYAINLGQADLSLRLLFADTVAGPPSNLAITDMLFLPSGSGWTLLDFSVNPSDLITIAGSATDALSNVTEFRIFHNPNAAFGGALDPIPSVNALLGLDDISP